MDFLDVEGSVYSAIFVDDQFFIGGDFNLTINKKVAQHVAGLSSDFKKITFNPNVSYSTGKPIVKRVFYEPSYKRLFFVGRFNYVEKQLRVNAVAFKAEKEFILEPQFTPIGFNNSIDSINVNKDLNYLFLGGTFTIANREAHKGLFAFDYKTLQPIPKEKFKAVVDYSYGDPKVNIIHKWGESVLFGGQFSSVNSISGPYFNLFDLNSCHKCFF